MNVKKQQRMATETAEVKKWWALAWEAVKATASVAVIGLFGVALLSWIDRDTPRLDHRIDRVGDRIERLDENLREELQAVRTEINGVRKEVSEVRQDVSEVRQEVNEVRQEVSDVRQEVSDARQEVSEVRQEVNEVRQEVSEVRQEVSEVRQDVNDVQSEIAGVRTEMRDGFADLASRFDQLQLARPEAAVVSGFPADAETEIEQSASDRAGGEDPQEAPDKETKETGNDGRRDAG